MCKKCENWLKRFGFPMPEDAQKEIHFLNSERGKSLDEFIEELKEEEFLETLEYEECLRDKEEELLPPEHRGWRRK